MLHTSKAGSFKRGMQKKERKNDTHTHTTIIMKTDANDEIQIRRNNQTNRMTAK